MELYQHIVVASLYIWGVFTLFSPKMILFQLGEMMWDKLPGGICKPLYACPPCMASIHGTIYYLLFINGNVIEWALFCLALSGLNYIIKELIFE